MKKSKYVLCVLLLLVMVFTAFSALNIASVKTANALTTEEQAFKTIFDAA